MKEEEDDSTKKDDDSTKQVKNNYLKVHSHLGENSYATVTPPRKSVIKEPQKKNL